MSVVTKTGDTGTTSLFSGEQVSKTDPRIEALGIFDELISYLGVIRSQMSEDDFRLKEIQRELQAASALIANTKASGNMDEAIANLEENLNNLEEPLPPLSKFLIPGQNPIEAQTHLARSVCRRAERAVINIPKLHPSILAYANRLSDYLFICTRHATKSAHTRQSRAQ